MSDSDRQKKDLEQRGRGGRCSGGDRERRLRLGVSPRYVFPYLVLIRSPPGLFALLSPCVSSSLVSTTKDRNPHGQRCRRAKSHSLFVAQHLYREAIPVPTLRLNQSSKSLPSPSTWPRAATAGALSVHLLHHQAQGGGKITPRRKTARTKETRRQMSL